MKKLKSIQKNKLLQIAGVILIAVVGSLILIYSKAATPTTTQTVSSGPAVLSISPASGSYPINTEFTVAVNANPNGTTFAGVDMFLAYDTTKLDYVSVNTTGAAFTDCPGGVAGSNGVVSVKCVKYGSTFNSSIKVANVTFRTKVGTGTTALSFAANSALYDTNVANVWNGVATGGTYTLTGSGGTGGGSGGGAGGSGSSGGTTTGGSGTGSAPTTTSKTTTTGGGSSKTTTSTGASNQVAVNQPTTSSGNQTATGYYVSIVVTDDQARVVAGAEVVLDGIKSTTDASGIASFVNISAGAHKVKVSSDKGSYSASINVASSSNGSIQQFPVKVKKANNYLVYAAIGASVIVIGAAVLVVLRQRALKRLYGSYHGTGEVATVVSSAGTSSSSSTNAPTVMSSVASTPAMVKPGEAESQVIKPSTPAS